MGIPSIQARLLVPCQGPSLGTLARHRFFSFPHFCILVLLFQFTHTVRLQRSPHCWPVLPLVQAAYQAATPMLDTIRRHMRTSQHAGWDDAEVPEQPDMEQARQQQQMMMMMSSQSQVLTGIGCLLGPQNEVAMLLDSVPYSSTNLCPRVSSMYCFVCVLASISSQALIHTGFIHGWLFAAFANAF